LKAVELSFYDGSTVFCCGKIRRMDRKD